MSRQNRPLSVTLTPVVVRDLAVGGVLAPVSELAQQREVFVYCNTQARHVQRLFTSTDL